MQLSLAMTRERSVGLIFMVLAAVLWSIGGLLIKLVEWNPMAIAGIRSAIAAVVIAIAFRREKMSWSKNQWAGAISYCGMVTMFVTATKFTTAANAILLQYTAPIYVALLGAWLLKEKTTRQDWLIVFVVFSGMILFFLDHMSLGGLFGNLCGILSGVSFALFVIFTRRQKEGHPFGSVLIGNVLTFLIGLPFMFDTWPSGMSWLGLSLLGVFQLGLSYVLYSLAIRKVSALETTLITIVEPILNPVWVFLLVGERPGVWSMVGGLLIIMTIVWRYLVPQKEEGNCA